MGGGGEERGIWKIVRTSENILATPLCIAAKGAISRCNMKIFFRCSRGADH